MKNTISRLTFLLFCFIACQAFPQNETMNKLKKFFGNIAAYHQMYTQEKVYLHLDNNGYFPGETIWFKAYVLNAGSLLPTDMSKVLYVELLTPEGEVFQRKTYPILNGRTCGEFSLTDIIHTGFYEVRAYTRAMLNWDEAYIYSRVIPIYNPPADSLNYGKLTIYEPVDEIDKAFRRPAASVTKETNTQKEKDLLLTFYPEGGYMTKGNDTRVAFKITDKNGNPFEGTVQLYNSNKSLVDSAHTIHEGMGVITVPAHIETGYVEVVNAKGKAAQFTLPQRREIGCDISTSFDESQNLTITTKSNAPFESQILGVSVTCRGVACYFDTLHVTPSAILTKTIPWKQLRDGVHQVTLFNQNGEILSERLCWVKPHKSPLHLQCAQNEKVYAPFSPVALNFTLTNNDQQPLQGEFSLAVHDVAGELTIDGEDINTNLLLSSELKGYIHQPEYYFAQDDNQHQQALDLLLMVQGWRRYEWTEMAGVKPFQLKQPAEDGLLIDGRVVDNSSKHNGKEGMNIDLMIMQGASFVSGRTTSDAEGNFALLAPKFYGDNVGYFTTSQNDKKKSCNVALNRGFSPDPLAYNPQALIFSPFEDTEQQTIKEPELFVWQDTLPKIIHLPEVNTKAKRLFHPYGSRYTWSGGENEGKKVASLYYNVEDALEKMLDKGEQESSLWDWLAKVNPHLVIEMPDISVTSSFNSDGSVNEHNEKEDPTIINPILTYKGHPVKVLIDNAAPIGDINYLMSDVRSLVISEDQNTWNKFKNPDDDASSSPTIVTFLLYSRVDKSLVQYKKGQRITVLHGYSKYEEFYSPQYRTFDTPTPSDVRRTLYWNPNVTTDKDGKASVLFFSNSRKEQRIRYNAQGISVTGQMFSSH